MQNRDNLKPWPGKNNHELPDKCLKSISTNWDTQTWDRYLDATVDVNMKESLLDDPATVDTLSQERYQDDYIGLFGQSEEFPNLQNAFDEIIKCLPEKEAIVIRLIFYNGLNIPEVSKKIGYHKTTIIRLRDKGISSLKKMLVNIRQKGD